MHSTLPLQYVIPLYLRHRLLIPSSFNYLQNLTTFIESQIGPIFEIVNQTFTQSSLVEQDSAVYPNPFFGVNASVYEDSAQHFIALVDAGNNGEAVPNQPLLVKARKVEVIIAVDGVSFTVLYLIILL